MSTKVSCPTCGRQFRLRDEIVGRKVRCTGCKEPFTAEAEIELAPEPVDYSEPEVQPTSMARPGANRLLQPAKRPVMSRADTEADAQLQLKSTRIGRNLLIVGVLGLIYPLFGRQHWMFTGMGAGAGIVAGIFILVGGFFLAAGMMEWGSPFLHHFNRVTQFGVKLIFAVFFGALLLALAVGLMVRMFWSPSNTSRSAQPMSQPPVTAPRGKWNDPPRPAPSLAEEQQSAEQKFGPERVYKIHVIGKSYRSMMDARIFEDVSQAMKKSAGVTWVGGRVSGNSNNAEATIIVAPINDFNAMMAALPFQASAMKADRTARIVNVDFR